MFSIFFVLSTFERQCAHSRATSRIRMLIGGPLARKWKAGGTLTFAIRTLQAAADAKFVFDEMRPPDAKFASDESFLASDVLSASPPLPARARDRLTQKHLPAGT